jgi:hypothetical protein
MKEFDLPKFLNRAAGLYDKILLAILTVLLSICLNTLINIRSDLAAINQRLTDQDRRIGSLESMHFQKTSWSFK